MAGADDYVERYRNARDQHAVKASRLRSERPSGMCGFT